MSARTPTRSELNTFKVLSNLDFTDLAKPEPTKWTPAVANIQEADWGGNMVGDVNDGRGQSQERHLSQDRRPSQERRPSQPPTPREPSHERAPSQERPQRLPSVERADFGEPYTEHAENTAYAHDEAKPDAYERQREDSMTRRKAAADAAMDVSIEKEALLYELELMEKQGLIKLHRQLDMGNSLEEIQYQYDRSNMIVSTQQTVDWAKTGIKMGSNILESLMKKFGINVVDGFSNNLCKDMSKFNKPLTKMYRKYWRRGTSSPEMELAMIVFGALAMTVMGNKGLMGSKPASEPMTRPQVPEASGPPSALRPPSMNGFGFNQQPVAPSVPVVQTGPKQIPEWARAALSGPQEPQHFAKVVPPKIEVVPAQQVLVPPAVAAAPVAAAPVAQTEHFPELNRELQMPVIPVPETKRLTLSSPKSSRRRREPQPELNLDE